LKKRKEPNQTRTEVLELTSLTLYLSAGSQPRCLVNLFNAELSPKRYRWGPKSKAVGEDGAYT